MRNLIILILITPLLQSCRICCNGNPKLTTRYMSTCIDSIAPNIEVPEIISITDVVGKEVVSINDGVYIVKLSNNERVKIIN
jgi:hypothetical protein